MNRIEAENAPDSVGPRSICHDESEVGAENNCKSHENILDLE